MLFFNMAA